MVVSQSMEGQAPHYLGGRFGTDYGGPGYRPRERSAIPRARQILVCSAYQGRTDLDSYGPGNVVPCDTWSEVLIHLMRAYSDGVSAAVYPYAAIQLPA